MDRKTIEKINGKNALYRKLIGTMAINAAQRSDNTHNRLWAPRYFEIFRTIKRTDIPNMIEDLNMYIYGNTTEPWYGTPGSLYAGTAAATDTAAVGV